MWTKAAFQNLFAERLYDRRLIVVAHEPPHAASRMASSLKPLMRAVGGTWVCSDGSAPESALLPLDPAYTVRRVPLSPDLENAYYQGLANRGLWPLCHAVFHQPVFERHQWESYRRANGLFAEAVLEEAGGRPAVVFVQNYPLALLAGMLKARNPNLLVAQFWHIPWPDPETFNIFPWKGELLQGLLANDLLGFQQRYDCCNFLKAVDYGVEARIEREQGKVTHAKRTTTVLPFPMGIDVKRHAATAASPAVDREIDYWQRQFGLQTEFVGIGIDHLDYATGILERLRAFDQFLGRHPEFCERVTFVQICLPSWEHRSMEGPLSEQITRQVEKINRKRGNRFWRPVVFLQGELSQTRLIALHRLANFCLVSPLHDGMNLVAKEFVSSRIDGDGVLILSQFSGAAAEFADALLVNPFAEEEIEGAIYDALRMNVEERRGRMRRLRETAATNNIYRWAGKIISTLLRLEEPAAAYQAAGEEVVVSESVSVGTAAQSVLPFRAERSIGL